MISLRPYQSAAIARVRECVRAGKRRVLIVAPTGSGKCLGRGTPVLLYDGRVAPVETIRRGDMLMGPDSKPREVLSTTEGYGSLYRITPVKGDAWICNEDHILTVVHTTTGVVEDVCVRDWLSSSNWFRSERKQFMVGVDYAPSDSLPVDPYFMGLWLGDGSKGVTASGLRGLVITKPDPEVEACVRDTAKQWGLAVRRSDSNGTRCVTWHLVGPRNGIVGTNPLLNVMRDVLGPDLRVPLSYLTASREDRLSLLAGWIDSDGHINNGYCDIVQKNKQHADALCHLARSLGFRIARTTKFVNGDPYERMSISGDLSVVPMRIPRKQASPRRQKKDVRRTGFSVERIEPGPYFGFKIDGDGRFLLGDFTVTHNTVQAGEIIRGAVAKGSRCLFLAHRKELIDQPSRLLDSMGIDHGIIKGDHWRNRPHLPLQIASVQTLVRRDKPPADIVIVDETHLARARSYELILEHYPNAVLLGLTATPWRADRKGFTKLFDEIVLVAKPAELVAQGYLIDPRTYVPSIPDMAGVKMHAGDYSARDAQKAMERSVLVGDIVSHWRRFADGRPTIGFACTVEHSQMLAQAFCDAGIAAEHVDGGFSDKDRDAVFERLAGGATLVVWNVSLVAEGYDLPMLSCCILAAPTKSLTRYVQCVGRIMRPTDGKTDAILLDHAGSTLRHGSVTEDREYTLEGDTKKRTSDAGLKICPECMQPLLAFLGACTCGYEFPIAEINRDPTVMDGELIEYKKIRHRCKACEQVSARMIDVAGTFELKVRCTRAECGRTSYVPNLARAAAASHAERMEEYDRLCKMAAIKRLNKGWAAHRYHDLFNRWPRRSASARRLATRTRSGRGSPS